MEAIINSVCGLDVHQASVTACVLRTEANGRVQKQIRTYPTVTRGLTELADWLRQEGVTQVVMESTGVYWKPVYNVLEKVGGLALVVANAHHVKNVPGRKTDVKDAEWLATLLRHGLIRASFVPNHDLRRLRDLLRYRRKLVEGQTAERNRVMKLLESANIKLSSVASDVFGVSGRLMLAALVEGTTSPQDMANLARGRLRSKLRELELALEGSVDDHHRRMLRIQLGRVDAMDQDIAAVDEMLNEYLEPYQGMVDLLDTIDGVDRITAATIIAEIGVDMNVFANERALSSWAGLCPGNNESAGKRRSGRTTRGNVHLRTTLIQAAISASKKAGSYLKDKYHRLKARRGGMRAAVAVARKILIAAYHIIRTQQPYRDLGAAYLDQLDRHRTAHGLIRRLRALGYTVEAREPPAVTLALDGPAPP